MLTDRAVKAAPKKDKVYKLADERGLFLHVTPGGSKLWRMRFKRAGAEQLLSFGPYPEVSLADARAALREGRNPRDEKRLRLAAAQPHSRPWRAHGTRGTSRPGRSGTRPMCWAAWKATCSPSLPIHAHKPTARHPRHGPAKPA